MIVTKKTWKSHYRFFVNNFSGYPHPVGYCGNQMCCWGKPGDKVLWPEKRSR